MEENFGMERKIFSMQWKLNGRKLPIWNIEKSSSIPFHTMPCRHHKSNKMAYKGTCLFFFALNTISCFILSREVEVEVGSSYFFVEAEAL